MLLPLCGRVGLLTREERARLAVVESGSALGML